MRIASSRGRGGFVEDVALGQPRALVVDDNRSLAETVGEILADEGDEVETCMAASFRYAYVIYDLDHRKNVNIVHSYLEDNHITPIGRFGEWEYHNMDKAIQSGKRAAEALLR